MNNQIAVNLLSILGSDVRLPIFKMLIQAGEKGLNPKYISDELAIKPNKLSFHLNGLKKSELIRCVKKGREMVYYANYQTTRNLVEYLFDNCCNDDETDCLDVNLCN
ncbi:MAG: putative transcriptional regulator [Lentimonas sp.]|jgi:predicted transcriptional regulator